MTCAKGQSKVIPDIELLSLFAPTTILYVAFLLAIFFFQFKPVLVKSIISIISRGIISVTQPSSFHNPYSSEMYTHFQEEAS